jgi:hypothetical protein
VKPTQHVRRPCSTPTRCAPKASKPLDSWRKGATDASGGPIGAAHFLCESAPEAAAEALIAFFSAP